MVESVSFLSWSWGRLFVCLFGLGTYISREREAAAAAAFGSIQQFFHKEKKISD
jgi:hypothetical protein